MRVEYTPLYGDARQMELSEALRPENTCARDGQMEDLEDQVEVLQATVGRLAAALVEHGVLDLNDAGTICGVNAHLEEVTDERIE